MHSFVPRFLTVLSLIVVFSFLPATFALGGLVGGLVDTVEDVLEVDQNDDETQLSDDSQTETIQEEESTGTTDEPTDTNVDGESQPIEEELQEPATDDLTDTDIEDESEQVADEPVTAEQDELVQVEDDLLALDGEDKTVRVENELLESVADAAGLDSLGDLAYTVQEDVLHGSITKITGKKVDHFYVWMCIGNACVPVDPFTVSN